MAALYALFAAHVAFRLQVLVPDSIVTVAVNVVPLVTALLTEQTVAVDDAMTALLGSFPVSFDEAVTVKITWRRRLDFSGRS